jgi:adenine deaminase
LQIATFNAARLLKRDTELGSISPGKRADFVLVEGNPATQIVDIRRCQLVMKNGVLYDSAKVYAAVGIQSPSSIAGRPVSFKFIPTSRGIKPFAAPRQEQQLSV